MRSWLFVPGDDPAKLGKALGSGADALILDLEDSVASTRKGAARACILSFLRESSQDSERPMLFVRINPLDSDFCDSDLDHVMTAAPDGIVLPKAGGGADIALLSSRIAVREALHGIDDGATRILAIATETPAAIFALGAYADCSPRLCGLAWGGEDLAAEIGARASKEAGGGWTEPFRLVRNLCLFGAAAAGVDAVDTVFTAYRDEVGLRLEAEAAARDGFAGKLAIHPGQVAAINDAFTPSEAALADARRVIELFEAEATGVVGLNGHMLDAPHLKAARRLLARAERYRA